MNYKIIAIILVMFICCTPFSVAMSDSSKYVDNNPVKSIEPKSAYGWFVGYIRAGGSAQDLDIYIVNDLLNLTFDPTYHPDRTSIEGQNKGFLKVTALPDGKTSLIKLQAGNYTAYMRQSNGDQPESVKFKIGGGEITGVRFLGAAVTSNSHQCDEKKYAIKEAKYGAITSVCDETETHTEYSYWITSTPAHTEYSFRDWVVDVPGTDSWTESHPTEFPGSHFVEDTEAYTEYRYSDYIIDIPEHVEQIIGVPEHTEYKYRDWIEETTKEVCYPETSHSERQISTWKVVSPAIPATGRLAEYETGHVHAVEVMNCPVDAECFKVKQQKYRVTLDEGEPAFVIISHGSPGVGREADYETGHVHARHETIPSQVDFYYGSSSMHITGNKHDVAYIVTPGTPAVYGWVITFPWSDGQCVMTVRGLETCISGETKCEERTVVDSPAYCEVIVDVPAHWSEWSDFSDIVEIGTSTHEVATREVPATYKDIIVPATYKWSEWSAWGVEVVIASDTRHVETREIPATGHYELFHPAVETTYKWSEWSVWSDIPVTAIPDQREVQTRFVSDDLENGYYAEWSDTPEGSCVQRTLETSMMSWEPPHLNAPCITREVDTPVCHDEGIYIDVTSELKSIVKEGTLKFVFGDDGIFAEDGTTLLYGFTDPTPGTAKKVVITYTKTCPFTTQTIEADEYSLIDLTSGSFGMPACAA